MSQQELAPAIKEAARIAERIRRAFYCAGCRHAVVFKEFDLCLNCRGSRGNRVVMPNWSDL
jgi:hypothetical protein